MRLEHRPQLVDLLDLVGVERGDREPAMRLGRGQALVLEHPEGLSDGDATGTECRREVLLAQARARRQDAVEDGLTQRLEDQVLRRLVLGALRLDECGQRRRLVRDGLARDGHS